MDDTDKNVFENEKVMKKLTKDEFNHYSKNVKSIYFYIGIFTISIFILGISILLLVVLQSLNILKVSDIFTYIMALSFFFLFILSSISLFKKIVNLTKEIYLDKTIIVDLKVMDTIKRKYKQAKFKVISTSLATLICSVIGVVIIVITEARYPGNTGYITLSVALMFLMITIPLFLAIYFYSDIYIYNYIEK